MRKLAVALVCVACVCHGRRVREQDETSDPATSLKALLLDSNLEAAFNPSLGVTSRTSSAPARVLSAASPVMADAAEAEEALKQAAQESEIIAEIKKDDYFKSVDSQKLAPSIGKFLHFSGVSKVLNELDGMIGLTEVKNRVRGVASTLVLDKIRRRLDLDIESPPLHMSFTGAPGTGKTTVALRMGQILKRMDYLKTGQVVVATRDDLVGKGVDETAPKTKEMVKKAIGGILLIDEAHRLYDANDKSDPGVEACEVLMSVMETMQDDVIVIFTGEKDLMESFWMGIPRLKFKIGNFIDFPSYKDDELIAIAGFMTQTTNYTITNEALLEFESFLKKRKELPSFSYARTVSNAMEMARKKSAVRTYIDVIKPLEGGDYKGDVQDLTKITAKDIPTIAEMEEGRGMIMQ